LTLSLCSNSSNGFHWIEQAEISDPALLVEVSHELKSARKDEPPPPPGTPAEQEWTFSALSPGQTTIAFECSQPREDGEERT